MVDGGGRSEIEGATLARASTSSGIAALHRMAEISATARDVEDLFQRGGAELLEAFGADGLSIYLLPTGDSRLRVAYQVGVEPADAARYEGVPVELTATWQVMQDGRPRNWCVEDYKSVDVRRQISATAFTYAAVVALQVRSRRLGCVNLGFRGARRLSEDELGLLQVMCAHFAAAIEGQNLAARERLVSKANAFLYDELRATGAELSAMQSQLYEKERLAALGEMAAVLAHEIRNPLAVLANGLALLRSQPSVPAEPFVVAAMGQEVERMNALVADLLDFARPLKLEPKMQPLTPLLSDVAEAAGSHAPIEVEVSSDLSPVLVDAPRLRQALLNVATNAVQAAGSRGQVWIRARASGGEVCIEVEDTGPGIPLELRQRIFEPFFTTKASGTGLGLPLAKRIVELHHGRIELASRTEGAGTRVRIALPGGIA